ncbi:MAG: M20/M25/M40 family metallo-hydrolase [Thermaerobacterales bacterium]
MTLDAAVLQRVYAQIDADLDQHIERLRELVRQPSISGEDYGIRECAELVARFLREAGCDLVEIFPTAGHPVVYGELNTGAPRTLLIYMMYDVQPVAGEHWRVEPFAGDLVREGSFPQVLMARGATNSKGPLAAFINAVESIQAVGTCPVNLIFLAEGEEELGSPSLPGFIRQNQERLARADAMYFPMPRQEIDGRALLWPGTKGMLYFTLEVSGKSMGRGPQEFDIHSSQKAIVDNPAWRLVQALSTMASADGNTPTIDGALDRVRCPNASEKRVFDAVAGRIDVDAFRRVWRVPRFIDTASERELLRRYFFDATLNIDGISTGYTGAGTKTVLPHKATAKLDMRLVPEQDPHEVAACIRAHLDRRGFHDVQLTVDSANPHSQADPESAIVQAAARAARAFGVEPEVWPRNVGFFPAYLFSGHPLHLDYCVGGLGHGARAHGPDEYFVLKGDGFVKGLDEIEKCHALTLFEFAKPSP